MSELMEWLHEGKPFIGTPQHLIDELGYSSYKFHRLTHPEHPASAWGMIFPTWEAMERRYQQETGGSPPLPTPPLQGLDR